MCGKHNWLDHLDHSSPLKYKRSHKSYAMFCINVCFYTKCINQHRSTCIHNLNLFSVIVYWSTFHVHNNQTRYRKVYKETWRSNSVKTLKAGSCNISHNSLHLHISLDTVWNHRHIILRKQCSQFILTGLSAVVRWTCSWWGRWGRTAVRSGIPSPTYTHNIQYNRPGPLLATHPLS